MKKKLIQIVHHQENQLKHFINMQTKFINYSYQNPNLSVTLIGTLAKFNFFNCCQNQLHRYIFSTENLDPDGNYINSFMSMGFDTIQLGPISYLPSIGGEARTHLGVKIPLANIHTFWEKQLVKTNFQSTSSRQNTSSNQSSKEERKKKNSKIGVLIEGNEQIRKYAPYLLQENLVQTVKQLNQLNEIHFENFYKSQSKKKSPYAIDQFTIRLNNQEIQAQQSQEWKQMIKQTGKQICYLLKDKHLKPENTASIKLFFQIPSKERNPTLYHEMIEKFPTFLLGELKTSKQLESQPQLGYIINKEQYMLNFSQFKTNKSVKTNKSKKTQTHEQYTSKQPLISSVKKRIDIFELTKIIAAGTF